VFPDLLETYPYKPKARIEEGQIISKYASSCMDTSDGFIFTVDTLYRLNSVAFRIEDPKSFCHPAVTAVGQLSGMPPLFFLSGIHGEFELCFTIPPDREDAFLAEMAAHGFTPVKAGTAVADIKSEKGIFIEGKRFPGTDVRNLWERSSSKEEYSMNLLGLINDFIKLS
jgi:thiamine-monophosphate kinase